MIGLAHWLVQAAILAYSRSLAPTPLLRGFLLLVLILRLCQKYSRRAAPTIELGVRLAFCHSSLQLLASSPTQLLMSGAGRALSPRRREALKKLLRVLRH